MNGRESRWVDPAPLEVSRPRLPWWTMLPGWVKLILSPLALVILLGWSGYQLGRVVFRYPLTLAVLAAVGWLWQVLGEWPLTVLGGVLLVGLFVWWWRARSSFERWVLPRPRTEFRRFVIYACQWRTVMRLSELTKDKRGKEHRPRLRRVRAEGWRDLVRVRMIKGQAPEQWELHASGLAHSFHATSCRVRVRKPGVLELDFIHHDPLARRVPVPALAEDPAAVDLRRVVIGRTETGKPWRLQLVGTHVLTVGVSGAGKGSLLWAVAWALAPAIRAGRVKLIGIDPKGGMELGAAPEVFDRVVFDNGSVAVTQLEWLALEVKRRAESYRGRRRVWTPETGDPFILLVIDELADLIAYQPDKALRDRATRAIQTITSQGRAPGVCVLGLLQDPRKEIISFRHLFSTRVAMRLDEPAQVDMVLGDGVRLRGANAHEISENTPGVAWVKEDGRREPVRARAFHVTDDDLAQLVSYLIGRSALPSAEVLAFPVAGGDSDGGAAA
ncbi:MAG TPA: FtsK/SpoIIIE domain-containing protein [Actinophytocola sp.]|uniref:type IV secretory system conjugative DNA transfer family protein n=1 Tax=Actinophytocola sp. TaxID=1872138 RepID=UPI002DB5E295|nr:FtsK/SpoIIIE domain-containing protein [Actinophytocola sp.]HEU5472041.1 FtsK/SpoIIIE domain-containing protein [Actinophytocola sp.]